MHGAGRAAHQSRYAWLKRRDRLDARERATLSWLSSQFSNTTIMWYLKEKAWKIWKGNRVRGARAAWQEWIQLAKASDIRTMVTVAELRRVIRKLNDRPRKRLGYRTPAQVFLGEYSGALDTAGAALIA